MKIMTLSELTPAQTAAFWRKLKQADGDCWIWTASQARGGYGRFTVRASGHTRCAMSHRLTYEWFVGPIPEDLQLDHLCRNRLCVNPAHLEPVTARENIHRSPIARAALNSSKTHCPQGHPYDEKNTHHKAARGSVQRHCRACGRDYMRRRRAAAMA